MAVTVEDIKSLIPSLACLPDCGSGPQIPLGSAFLLPDGNPLLLPDGNLLFIPYEN